VTVNNDERLQSAKLLVAQNNFKLMPGKTKKNAIDSLAIR